MNNIVQFKKTFLIKIDEFKNDFLKRYNNSECKIFISYAHNDRDKMKIILRYLRALENDNIKFWIDEEGMTITKDIDSSMYKGLGDANIFIAFVSESFLQSEYIKIKEVPIALFNYNKKELDIFPILLYKCDWEKVDWLQKIRHFPWKGTIMDNIEKEEFEQNIYLDIYNSLEKLLDEFFEKKK